jgi:hypothetical protein
MNQPAIPLNLQHAAMQHTIDQTKANFDKNKELSNLLKEIGEKRTKEINGLLGSKAMEYREFLEKNKEIARTMQPLFTATPEGRKIKRQFQKTRVDESTKFIRSLGINVNDFKSIISKYQEESKSIIEKTRAVEGSLEFEVGSIPPDVVHQDPDSPWLSFHPPYFYSHGDVYILWDPDLSAGPSSHYSRPEGSHYENHFTGEISCRNNIQIIASSDHETQLVATSSTILIYFQMPASGRLNIWSQWQCVESSYRGSLSNDFLGYSDATIMQSSRLVMSVGEQLGVEEAYFRLLDYGRHSSDDFQWSDNMIMPGEYRTFNLVTDIPYSAGQWVLMRTGIFDVQDVVLDDMTYSSSIKNSWRLNGVWVSSINP